MKKIKYYVLILFSFLIIIPNVFANTKMTVLLDSCIDGDTAKFITDKGVENTRFLAIDTPEYTKEKEPYGKEASEFTCNKLKKAKEIVLEFDKNSDKYDKYDRLLAWIWIDGILLQAELVKNGLAEVTYLYGDYLHTPLLLDYQNVAKAQKLNIWSEEEYKTENENLNFGSIILTILFGLVTYFYIKNK